jgi:hypothetical protein
VAEYRDKFIELYRYATKEVAEDKKKQELFLYGLAGSLQYQLMSYHLPIFQQLVDDAIHLEHKRKELGSIRGKPPALDCSGVCLAHASPHRRTPLSALEGLVKLLGSSSSRTLLSSSSASLSSSSSLLSSFSVLPLRLHAPPSSRVNRELQLVPRLVSSAKSLVTMPTRAR